MHILMCHNFYNEEGGENTVFRQERALLEKYGHTVTTYERHSKDIYNYGIMARIHAVMGSFFSLKTYREVRKLIWEKRPDIAIVQNVYPLISPSIYYVLSAMDVPIIQSIYNYRSYCINGKLYTQGAICERCAQGSMLNAVKYSCFHGSRGLSLWYTVIIAVHRKLRTLHRLVTKFIVPHHFVGTKLINGNLPAEKIRQNPNPFVIPPPAEGPDDRLYILFVGRLVKEKGILTLVEAMKHVSPSIGLTVVGDGEAMQDVVAMLDENAELKDRVDLKGFLWGDEVKDLFDHAAIFVLPSEWYDPSPIVLYTALSKGIPSVVSKLGSAAEIVDHGENGLHFEHGNARDLAKQINLLLTDESLRSKISVQARLQTKQAFSESVHYQRLHTILTEAVDPAP